MANDFRRSKRQGNGDTNSVTSRDRIDVWSKLTACVGRVDLLVPEESWLAEVK